MMEKLKLSTIKVIFKFIYGKSNTTFLFFLLWFSDPKPKLFSFFLLELWATSLQTIHSKIQTTVNSNQQKQITKQVKEQYPLIYFWVAEKTNQKLGKKSMYPQMFSVPGKRTKRSLARTKHARSEIFFPTLSKNKKINKLDQCWYLVVFGSRSVLLGVLVDQISTFKTYFSDQIRQK